MARHSPSSPSKELAPESFPQAFAAGQRVLDAGTATPSLAAYHLAILHALGVRQPPPGCCGSWSSPRLAHQSSRSLRPQRCWSGYGQAASPCSSCPTPGQTWRACTASSACTIEIVYSVIQRKIIKPADFADLDALAQRLVEFESRYNATAKPFDWTFTRADLVELCSRVDAHQPAAATALAA